MPKATATGQRSTFKSKESVEPVRVVARPIESFGYSIDHKDFQGHTFHAVSVERARASVHSALARRFGGLNVEVEFDEG